MRRRNRGGSCGVVKRAYKANAEYGGVKDYESQVAKKLKKESTACG